jgi:hypothetical protein
MWLVIIILLVVLLGGGPFGYRAGWWGAGAPYNAVGIILFVVILFALVGLIGGPWHHAYW